MATIVERPRQLLLDSLQHVGYGQGHVEVDWPYLNLPALGERDFAQRAGRLDIVAFHDERRHDWETSAVVCDLQSPEVVANADAGRQRCRMLFEATASPNVLFGGSDNVDLWLACETSNPRRIAGIGFNAGALRRAFADHRDSLERESLSRLRLGQRYLFDRVYEARRDQLADFMHVGLEQAVSALRRNAGNSIPKAEQEGLELSLSHVAMALLAARIMEDKFFGEHDGPSPNARCLIERARSASNGFFGHVAHVDLSALDKRLGSGAVNDLLSHIMAYLTGPACFSLITPDMLGDLYERALVANDRVGRSVDIKGIHYTPLSIAQHILRRIPIEEIPPSKRCILDPACGSGSFLMAATARLRDAFDANEPDAEDDVLEHLCSRVIGNDIDTIARLVTQMRYLLHHWIETGSPEGVPTPKLLEGDGLELKPADFGNCQPTVIVGNPPFNPATTAAKFLKRAVDLLEPGGFLGVIMPASFLRGRRDEGPDARFRLLEKCELLDVWEMPQGTVGIAARHSPCVVIARKTRYQGRRLPAVFKVAQSGKDETVAAFRDHLRATWVFAADALPATSRHWRDDPYPVSKSNRKSLCRIIASPIDAIWRSAASSCTLGDVCGDNIVPGIWARGEESVFESSPQKPAGFEPYFQRQSCLLPFFVAREDWVDAPNVRGLFVDPETSRWKKKKSWDLFRGLKLIVTARTNRNAQTQLVAAIDELGLFPEDDFRCIALNRCTGASDAVTQVRTSASDRQMLLWLAAILNSPLGQAWIAITSSPRGLTNEVLESLPLPSRLDQRIPDLVEATRSVERPEGLGDLTLWSQWSDRRPSSPGSDFATIAGQLNFLVFRSYGLSQVDFVKVTRYLESMTNPWLNGSADAHIVTYPERRIRGTVLSADTLKQQITVKLPRYSSDPLTIPIPHDIPGWAMAEGSEFTCLAPRNDRDPQSVKTNPWLLRDFRPLPYAYLTVKQLEEMVLQKSPGG